jgi:hypothetical protein
LSPECGGSHNIKIGKRSFENVAKLKYFAAAVTGN